MRNIENEPTSEHRELIIENQLDSVETYEFEGGVVDMYDVQPEAKKTEIPTTLFPGWAAGVERFSETIAAMSERGRRVLFVDATHGIDVEEINDLVEQNPEAKEALEAAGIAEAQMRKVSALINAMDEKEIEQTDLVAHSEGGVVALAAATAYPERFRNLVLVDPAGIIGEDTPQALIKRMVPGLLREFWDNKRRGGAMLWEGNKKVLSDPKRRKRLHGIAHSVKEVFGISRAQIPDLLQELKERGVGISVVHGVDDAAFPMDRVQEILGLEHVDGFYSVAGTHNEITLHPEKSVTVVDAALDALEKKIL